MHLLLFDIDGTLLDAAGAGRRAMERAGRAVLGGAFSLAGIDFAGALDPWIYHEAAARMGHPAPATHRDAFQAEYVVALEHELSRGGARALAGVLETLERLALRRDVTLGLVTGNFRDGAPRKLRAAGIAPERFAVGAFGDEAPTRPDLVRLALDRWGALAADPDPRRALVIGDTPRDVECARANGCVAVAVATGRHDAAALTRAGADVVLADLSDPAALLRLLDAAR